ncbi:FHA domain-containing protein [Candidatus Woesearchaeota archaeon]|nr:FHA domain-containing protein [Candidatus Woesearchaeota archaeon]
MSPQLYRKTLAEYAKHFSGLDEAGFFDLCRPSREGRRGDVVFIGPAYSPVELAGATSTVPAINQQVSLRPDPYDGGRELVHIVNDQNAWIVTVGRTGPEKLGGVEFDDPTVSRAHAIIYRKNDGVYVEDRKSRNGTFVNGQRILDTPMILPVAGTIRFGYKTLAIISAPQLYDLVRRVKSNMP